MSISQLWAICVLAHCYRRV